nr:copia protein [Tanacetum cinerariifolium]
LDLLFEAMYDDYIGGQPSATGKTVSPAQEPQVRQTSMASTTIADTAPTPTNSSSHATNILREPSRPVLTRNQLRSDGDMYMYALSLSTMEPKNVKEAMTDPAWIDLMQEELLQFKRLDGTIDPTLFIRRFLDDILVVQVYVDDIIFGSTHPRYIQLFSDLMKSRFEMSMIGKMTFFLGLQVNQSPCGIFINQSKYVLEILNKYGMESCDLVGTPIKIKDELDLDQNGTLVDATKYRSMIGSLMYLTSSRPDIVHATCLCARYQAKPTEKHLNEVKRIFRYLRGTINTGLWYSKDYGFELTEFSDADYAGCKDTFKSTSEAEYVSLSACCAQILWMRTQLTDYGFHFNKIPIHCDSKSAIAISCNPVQHSRTKHIAVHYHFIKEHVEKGTIKLYFVKTDYQLADIFTKALPIDRFNYLVRRLGMRSLSPKELERL